MMAEVSLLVHDLEAAVSPKGTGPLRGQELGELEVHAPASVAVSGDRIAAVGPPGEVLRIMPSGADCETVDGRGRVAVPGFVDCHTHAAFLGSRVGEFELRSRGASYEELHSAGGGILSTVSATRAGSEEELQSAVERHLGWMLEHGTLTAEVKSGYGLDRETELKSLRAIRKAAEHHPVEVHPTFLGAHTVPREFPGAAEYVEFVIAEVLPEAARNACAADVFLERGSFEAPEARRYLQACADYGLALRLHADHFEAAGGGGARLLARSAVAAVLLPACGLFLDLPLPPARLLVEEGAVVALASDFNPGSSFCESLPLVMNLGCTRLGLSPAEALNACTANAAHVLGLDDVGRLAAGCRADVLVLDASDSRYLAYHLGGDRLAARVRTGRLLASLVSHRCLLPS